MQSTVANSMKYKKYDYLMNLMAFLMYLPAKNYIEYYKLF